MKQTFHSFAESVRPEVNLIVKSGQEHQALGLAEMGSSLYYIIALS